MKSPSKMSAQYKRKTDRFFTGTEVEDALPDMQQRYAAAMSSINAYQVEALSICNSEGIPSGVRSSIIMFTNALYKLCISEGTAGSAAEIEALAKLLYFAAIYAWSEEIQAAMVKLCLHLFSVDVTLPS